MTDLSGISPSLAGIPVVADAATRDQLFPPSTRAQNQRVQNLGTQALERWNGSAWVTEFTFSAPPPNREVLSTTDYNTNNAIFNVKDFFTTGMHVGDGSDVSAAIAACYAAACAQAAAYGIGATVRFADGVYTNSLEQLINQNYITTEFDSGSAINYIPSAILTVGTVSASAGVATFVDVPAAALREGCRIILPDLVGTGTVTATAGALVFSDDQVMGIGTTVRMGKERYTIKAYTDTKHATCTRQPTFDASAFMFVQRSYLCSGFNLGMTTCTMRPHSTGATFASSSFQVAQECLRAEKLGAEIAKVAFINPRFLSNNDLIPKTMIRIESGSQCAIRHGQGPEGAWDAPGNIGYHLSGVDQFEIEHNTVFTEQSLRISSSLVIPSIGMDFSSFHDNLWGSRGAGENFNLTTRECSLIDSDVILTRVRFDDEATVRGLHGLYYDGVAPELNANISFRGWSSEQQSAESDGLEVFYFANDSLCYQLDLGEMSLGGAASTSALTAIGTVSASNGALTFSHAQGAPYALSASVIVVSGVAYRLGGFVVDAQHCSCYSLADYTLPTFSASSFTVFDGNTYLPTGNKGVTVLGAVGGKIDGAFYEGTLDALTVFGHDFAWENFWAQVGSNLSVNATCVLTREETSNTGSRIMPMSGRVDLTQERLLNPASYPTLIGENRVRHFEWAGVIADSGQEFVPMLRLSRGQWQTGKIEVDAHSNTGPIDEWGNFHIGISGTSAVVTARGTNSTNCQNTSGSGKLSVFPGVGGTDGFAVLIVENKLGQDCYVTIRAYGAGPTGN